MTNNLSKNITFIEENFHVNKMKISFDKVIVSIENYTVYILS